MRLLDLLLLGAATYVDCHNAAHSHDGTGPEVNTKYRKFIPQKYRDYVPEMDENGVEYQKYMQGMPAAEKFQDKVVPQDINSKYVPLSGKGNNDDEAPALMLAAADSKKDSGKDSHDKGHSEHSEHTEHSEHSDSNMGDFQKYLRSPKPGPVVNRKYEKFIPDKYRDYVPEMDENGVKYQKYMQGMPAAEKFQGKVVPQDINSKYVPLSGKGKDDEAPALMMAAADSKKNSGKDSHDKGHSEHSEHTEHSEHSDSNMGDFQKYLRSPKPGPVVNRKYEKFIPDKYRDYVPEMDENGVKYQKYMQGMPAAEKFQDKVVPQDISSKYVPLSGKGKDDDEAPALMMAVADSKKELLGSWPRVAIPAAGAALAVLVVVFRLRRPAPAHGLQEPLTADV